jgi:hypothetical protein
MKKMYRVIGIPVVLLELVLTSGCVEPNGQPNNTGTGALAGGLFGAVVGGLAGGRHAGRDALIGGLAGVVVGGVVGHMIDRDQQQRLQEQSPQTWQTIQHNDAVYQQQQQPTAPPPVQAPAPAQTQPTQTQAAPAAAPIPLTVDDIKALDAAGVKKEAIIAEIARSKSIYTQADIAALQQSDPNIDPAVIECMKKTGAS